MAHYGEALGNFQAEFNTEDHGEMLNTFEPNKESMYAAFDEYFNHPTMVKIKDINGYSMYMSKTYCLLSNECRYIVAFIIQDHMPTRTQERLISLKWQSLQTRTLSDNHSLPPHGYQPKREGMLNVLIDRIKIEKNSSLYTCNDLPITVTLLHDHKNSAEQYQQKGNVIAALETYNTIICLK